MSSTHHFFLYMFNTDGSRGVLAGKVIPPLAPKSKNLVQILAQAPS